MHDGEIVEHADHYIHCLQPGSGDRRTDLLEKSRTIDEGSVGIAAKEFRRQDLVEPCNVPGLHRPDVILVEREQRLEVRACRFACFHVPLFSAFSFLSPEIVASSSSMTTVV